MVILFLFLIGICVGSFLNVLADRLPNGENPFKGRSYCDNCRRTLRWYDMVPLLSFIILGGKCRYCKAKLSYYYPIVEFVTGLIFVITYIYTLQIAVYGSTIQQFNSVAINFIYLLFIFSALIVIFFTDLKYGIIPDAVLYPAIALTLVYHLSSIIYLSNNKTIEQFSNYLLTAVVSFLFFLFLYFVTHGRGMGFGDVKLAFFVGFFLGFPMAISAFYIAFLTGAMIGIILILWKKKRLRGSTIPFGPFLVIGIFATFFFGEKIIHLGSHWLSFW